jgi:hypothetical protein
MTFMIFRWNVLPETSRSSTHSLTRKPLRRASSWIAARWMSGEIFSSNIMLTRM